jgi:hypothetical protein
MTDIFAIEAAANWGDTTIRLERVDFYSTDANADMNDGGNWGGNLQPNYDQDVWMRDGGTASLTTGNIGTNYLYIGNDTTASTGAYRIRSDHSTTLGDSDGYGKVIINSGGELQVDWTLTVKNGSEIEMQSGSLLDADTLKLNIGANITGAGTIDIEDGFTNRGTITVSGGDLLIDSDVPVNLDGEGSYDGDGQIYVTGGNFTCNNSLTDTFSGHMQINSSRTVTFTEEWRHAGTLDINGGTSSSTRAKIAGGLFRLVATTDIDKQCETACDMLVGAATVTLADRDDNFYLGDGTYTRIYDSATFTGAGRLYGLAGSSLVLNDDVVIGIRLRAHGDLTIKEGGIGNATVDDAPFALGSTGTFLVEASGDGVCDLLDIDGTAYLSGTLDVDFISGYTPADGDSFTVLTCNARSGSFTSITWDGAFDLIASYTSTAVTLTVDYGDSATTVPEPSTVVLLLGALAVLGMVARKRSVK